MDKLEKWKGFIPDDEIEAYRKGAFGRKIGYGSRPALLNIDTTRMFVDPEFPQCGRAMPELIQAITDITATFRELDLPIYYSRRDDRRHPVQRGIWNLKLGNADEFIYSEDPRADEWPAEYAPREGKDVIVFKNKPSCFFETPLESWLRYDNVDTLIVIGVSTSGCIRAGAVDAFSHNFRVVIPEEAVGDRSASAHRANLFDLDMKSADVEPLSEVIEQLKSRYARTAAAE